RLPFARRLDLVARRAPLARVTGAPRPPRAGGRTRRIAPISRAALEAWRLLPARGARLARRARAFSLLPARPARRPAGAIRARPARLPAPLALARRAPARRRRPGLARAAWLPRRPRLPRPAPLSPRA